MSLMSLLVASPATAQPTAKGPRVLIELTSSISYGEPVQLHVQVVDPTRNTGPPTLPPVEGLRLAGPGRPSVSQSTTLVDGRVTSQRRHTYRFSVKPEPGRTGVFTVGPVRVERSGAEPLVSNTLRLAVHRKPPLGILVDCEVTPSGGPVGAPFRVVYTISFPHEGPTGRRNGGEHGLRNLHLPVLEYGDLKSTSIASLPGVSDSTIRLGDNELIVQRGFNVTESGHAYATLVFAFDVVPRKTTTYELGKATAKVELTTGNEVRRRDIFGRVVRVPEKRAFSGRSESVVYRVHDLPRQGQPPGFTGAVGRYTISVETTDTKVRAFDPIQLEITVTGSGILEDLSAPDWTQIASLTKDFRVNRDVDAGEIFEGTKIFRQVVRALRDDVTRIPALPFPYYDPWERKYRNALSKPIPIEVSAAHTVGAESAIGPSRPASPRSSESTSPTTFVVEESGVPPNFQHTGAPVPSLVVHRRLLDAPFLIGLGAPPLAFAALLLLRRFRRKDPVLRARGRALSTARAALTSASGDPEAVSAAYQGFFRDRFAMPPGEITPEQLQAVLSQRGADTELTKRAVDCLEVLLAGRFGAASRPGGELARSAVEILTEVERC